MRKLLVPAVGTLALIMGAAGGCGSEAASTASESASSTTAAADPKLTVTGVVDGDIVDLSDGRRVRLLGIDTPEKGECGYEQANQFARTSLLDKTVEVASDPTQADVDQYGRSLVYIETLEDYSIAAARAGWAKRYVFENNPVQKDPQIRAAELVAQGQKAGIWGTLCAPPPPPPPPPSEPTQAPASQDNNAREPVPKPEPKPESKPASVYYKNCTAARAAGAAPVYRGDPGYAKHLDRDGDGVGCE